MSMVNLKKSLPQLPKLKRQNWLQVVGTTTAACVVVYILLLPTTQRLAVVAVAAAIGGLAYGLTRERRSAAVGWDGGDWKFRGLLVNSPLDAEKTNALLSVVAQAVATAMRDQSGNTAVKLSVPATVAEAVAADPQCPPSMMAWAMGGGVIVEDGGWPTSSGGVDAPGEASAAVPVETVVSDDAASVPDSKPVDEPATGSETNGSCPCGRGPCIEEPLGYSDKMVSLGACQACIDEADACDDSEPAQEPATVTA